MIFLDLSEGMENCKMSGKNQGKVGILRWMISGNPVYPYNGQAPVQASYAFWRQLLDFFVVVLFLLTM